MADLGKVFADFTETVRGFGVKKGDILYVASDITRLMYWVSHLYGDVYDEYMDGLVNALQDVVGIEGTLLFPVFTWDFCRGKGYSIKKTKGEVGAFNNWILRKRSDFRRTQHPMYSFMVWGKDADLLQGMTNRDAWGEDSPFAYLWEYGAKTLMIDVVPGKCFTFMHYVERHLNVPWRYMKEFVGDYMDEQGKTEKRIYSMFVRDLDIESKQVTDPAVLAEKGILHKSSWADIDLWFMDCGEVFPVYVDDIRNHNAQMCYAFQEYVPNWENGQTHPDELRSREGVAN